MQFIPSTWAYAGRDGDRDGKRNPHDLDDAALAAAGYLCSGSGSMLDDSSAKAAIFRYNPSDYYVALVQAFERGYRTGVFVIPSPPAPESDQAAPRKKKKAGAGADRDGARDTRTTSAKPRPKPSPKDDPSPKPAPKPSPKPTPKPSPSPTPSPTGPVLEGLSGQLAACNGGSWCVGGKQLDLGAASRLDGSAARDYDADGTKETVAAELAGLEGKTVNLQVGAGTAPAVVYVINGEDYRFADGSFA
jgi:hypothetical protein